MSLRQLLGLDLPVIQAPMAGAQDSAMAAEVSNAGGLGSLPGALLEPAALAAELSALRQRTSRPYNVNFFCHRPPAPDAARLASWRERLAPYYRELGLEPPPTAEGPARRPFDEAAAEVLSALRPPVVSFHFGLPDESLLAGARSCGAKVIATATTVNEARWLEARGVDVIVAQGLEAGGHRGNFLSDDLTTQLGTIALVPQLVRAVRVPIVAAGGLADAAGVRAALELGAAGVQIGTAYLLCPEAKTSAVHKKALESPGAVHTALTNLYTGRPARGIVTRLMRELGPLSPLAPEFPQAAAAVAPLRARAEASGSSDFSPLWAGQNTSGCRAVPAATLTRELAGC